MAEKIKFRIPPEVAVYVRPGVSCAERLRGVDAASGMAANVRVTLLFCLQRDADTNVKNAALAAFQTLPAETLLAAIATPDIHPAILDLIARHCASSPDVVTALRNHPLLSEQARVFLASSALPEPTPIQDEDVLDVAVDELLVETEESWDDDMDQELLGEDETVALGEEPIDEEEYFSKYQLVQQMEISEKIKMALTGDKEWRSILVKDANKLVSSGVIKNPRITDGEILNLLKVGVQNDEIIRLICDNKEWVKVYKIRKALVESPKTPLQNALRYLASLNDKDIASFAKSKNISSVISTNAKRMILAKKR